MMFAMTTEDASQTWVAGERGYNPRGGAAERHMDVKPRQNPGYRTIILLLFPEIFGLI
jgi:hypothetical protein